MTGFVRCPCCRSPIPVGDDDIGLTVNCPKTGRLVSVRIDDIQTAPVPVRTFTPQRLAGPRRSKRRIGIAIGTIVLLAASTGAILWMAQSLERRLAATSETTKPPPAVEEPPSTAPDSPSPPSVPPKPEPAAPKPAEWKGTTPTLPGLTHLSPIYRVFPADIVKPLYLPDPTAFPNEINRKIWDFCQGQLGLKVGNGQCAAINHEAIKFATGSFPSIKGPDYVWGTLIATIAPGKADGVAKIQPGDLMQFRQVQFSGSYKKNGTTWTWRSMAGHADGSIGHSAVVRAVADGGYLLNTFEQNLSDIQIEMKGVYNLRELTAGTIWIYRAK